MEGITLKKCGVRFDPPAVLVYYTEEAKNKLRKRVMPVRNMKKNAGVSRIAEEMKDRHSEILKEMPVIRLEKLLRIIQERMKGNEKEDCIQNVKKEFEIDSEENLNKLDDEALKRKKEIMEESFKASNKNPSDPDFQYDVEVNFENQEGVLEVCEWDSEQETI